MRHVFAVPSLLAAAALFAFCWSAGSADYDPQKEVVIHYAEFEGRPVELIFDGNFQSVTLRARLKAFPPPVKSPELEFLKQEVKKIKETKRIVLGDTGYELVYKGGHPLWEPMSISDPPSECLTFATGSLKEKIITAKGGKKKDLHYPDEE